MNKEENKLSEYEQVKKQLKEYNMKNARIDIIEKEIELIEEECGVSGINYEGTGSSNTNLINSITEEAAITKVEAVKYLEIQLNALKRDIRSIDIAIAALNSEENEIITLFYIQGREWWYISDRVKYSKRQCIRKRDNAINKMKIALLN